MYWFFLNYTTKFRFITESTKQSIVDFFRVRLIEFEKNRQLEIITDEGESISSPAASQ